MGIDLYVIKPEHYEEYCGDKFACMRDLHILSDGDEWYKDEKHDYYHRIWSNWRNGQYEDDEGCLHPLPNDLRFFFYSCGTHESAKDTAAGLRKIDGMEMKNFVEWIEFWVSKGAYFHLST